MHEGRKESYLSEQKCESFLLRAKGFLKMMMVLFCKIRCRFCRASLIALSTEYKNIYQSSKMIWKGRVVRESQNLRNTQRWLRIKKELPIVVELDRADAG